MPEMIAMLNGLGRSPVSYGMAGIPRGIASWRVQARSNTIASRRYGSGQMAGLGADPAPAAGYDWTTIGIAFAAGFAACHFAPKGLIPGLSGLMGLKSRRKRRRSRRKH